MLYKSAASALLAPSLLASCQQCPCQAKHTLTLESRRRTSAPVAGLSHGTSALHPQFALLTLYAHQVPSSDPCALPLTGRYQAGRSHVLLRASLGPERLCSPQTSLTHVVLNTHLELSVHANGAASQRLSVALHTLPRNAVAFGQAQGSTKAAEAPTRYWSAAFRGHCSGAQRQKHASLGASPAAQASIPPFRVATLPLREVTTMGNRAGRPRTMRATRRQAGRKRPQPPVLPAPRWRPKRAHLDVNKGTQQADHTGPGTVALPSNQPAARVDMHTADQDMVELEIEVEEPEPPSSSGMSSRIASAHEGDSTNAANDETQGSRFSAPMHGSDEPTESDAAAGGRGRQGLVLVAQARDGEADPMERLQAKGSRSSAPDSSSDELVAVDMAVDDAEPCPNLDGRKDADLALPQHRGRRNPRRGQPASNGTRPWSRADTELSKTLSQVLRHRSHLRLDSAGYAGIPDILANARIRKHQATEAWLRFIIQENDKQRFTLDATGTRVRAAQGHSVYINPEKLLQRVGLADLGRSVPEVAFHSTFNSFLRPILQHGLIPGGWKGEKFRRHVHLATERTSTAGLRSGFEVILEVDLERACNSGCTFYRSENGVLLTEDIIPPPCIMRATRTESGRVVELDRLRPQKRRTEAVLHRLLPATQCSSPHDCTHENPVRRKLPLHSRQTSSSKLARSARRPASQDLGLTIKPLLPCPSDMTYLCQPFRPQRIMQSGTPVGNERRYSWITAAGRSVVSTPPGCSSSSQAVGPEVDSTHSTGFSRAPEANETTGRQQRGHMRQSHIPKPSRAPWLPAPVNKLKQVCRTAGKRPYPEDTDVEHGKEGLTTPTLPRGRTAYYEGDEPLESSQAADYAESGTDPAVPEGGVAVRYEVSSPSSPKEQPEVESAHACRDEEAAATSRDFQEELIETAIDFCFAAHDSSARTRPPRRQVAHRPMKAAAKSLVRSGLRCHKCHLRSWVCLCDRAPLEIDRRGRSFEHQGQYMLTCLLGQTCTSLHCLLTTFQHASLRSGPATPWKHARRGLTFNESLGFLSTEVGEGLSDRVGLSTPAKRNYWPLLVLNGPLSAVHRRTTGRPWHLGFAPQTHAWRGPWHSHAGGGSISLLPHTRIFSLFFLSVTTEQITFRFSYKHTSSLAGHFGDFLFSGVLVLSAV